MISAQADALMWSIKYNIERTIESTASLDIKTEKIGYFKWSQPNWVISCSKEYGFKNLFIKLHGSQILCYWLILNYYTEK